MIFTTEIAEICGMSRRSSQAETKPESRRERGRLYDFSPTRRVGRTGGSRRKWARNLNRPHLGFEEYYGIAANDLAAVQSLLSQTFRNTLSTPSAADSEFSPVGIEFALRTSLKRRGRKFAESDAFFGGLVEGLAIPSSSEIFRSFRSKKDQGSLSNHKTAA